MAARRKPARDDDVADRLRRIELRLHETEARLERLEREPPAPSAWAPPVPQAFAPAPSPPTFQPLLPGAAFERVEPPPETSADLERQVGAKWLPKVGMLVFILGVVFFLRYAFDQGWINRPARIGMGVVAGLLLWGLGDLLLRRDAKRFWAYSQILAGGGVAITYFSLFAAQAFPDYRAETGFTIELTAILLGTLAVGAAAYAFLRRTPILLMEAAGLGVLASLYAETWAPFSVLYLVVLATAVAFAAGLRGWDQVVLLTVVASYADLVALTVLMDSPWSAMGAALGLLGVFSAFCARPGPGVMDGLPIRAIAAGVAVGAAWGVVLIGLEDVSLDPRLWHGPFTGGLAVLAIAAAFIPHAHRPTRYIWGAVGVGLLLVWPPLQFDDLNTAIAWSVLAVVGAALYQYRRWVFVQYGLVANGIVLVAHLAVVEALKLHEGTLDPFLGLLPFALGTSALAWAWWRTPPDDREEHAAAYVFLALAMGQPLLYMAAALDGFQISVGWAAWATAVLIVGFLLQRQALRVAALVTYALVLGRIFLVDLTQFDVIVRIVTFLVVGGLLLVAGYLYARRPRRSTDATSRPPS